MITHLNKNNFEETIRNNNVVLVDFFAEWCGPCRALHPALEKVAEATEGQAIVAKVNVDEEPELATQFGITSIPALLYFSQAELQGKAVGLQTAAAMESNLQKLIKANADASLN